MTPRPVRFQAPSVGIDAQVVPTGVTVDGAVAIPKDAYRVGWYRFGPAPGAAAGSAVIVGHVDSKTQGRGALFPLVQIDVGDVVTVTDSRGDRLRYRVVAREVLEKKGLPVAELFARTGPARLTVITCGGPYLADRGGYQDNVVVTAVPLTEGANP